MHKASHVNHIFSYYHTQELRALIMGVAPFLHSFDITQNEAHGRYVCLRSPSNLTEIRHLLTDHTGCDVLEYEMFISRLLNYTVDLRTDGDK